jgi:SAM-dependent methyltransferase
VSLGLLFAGSAGPLDYGRRLCRLRWRRAFPETRTREASTGDSAAEALSSAGAWIAVRDEMALPLPGAHVTLQAGVVALPASRAVSPSAVPHTLRELEEAPLEPRPGVDLGPVPALAFSTSDFPPSAGETLGAFLERLCRPPTPSEVAPGFALFAVEDPFERERPDVTRRIALRAGRLLDVGCGAGAASSALKRERPGLVVEGIERDPVAAARAETRLDRVHLGDALTTLSRLAAAGERFDAFVFADVLEHLEDPIAALALARRLAAPGACLVASVPNVGHVSIVRDLVFGRFDPVPAGLADAGHLRWFTRHSLAEALEEAGWSVQAIEAETGAPARETESFLAWFRDWPDLDRESLGTYQWIAVAHPNGAEAAVVHNAHGTV